MTSFFLAILSVLINPIHRAQFAKDLLAASLLLGIVRLMLNLYPAA